MASAFGVGVILLVIFFFTPIFYFLPYVVLGSIVIMAVLPLIEYQVPPIAAHAHAHHT